MPIPGTLLKLVIPALAGANNWAGVVVCRWQVEVPWSSSKGDSGAVAPEGKLKEFLGPYPELKYIPLLRVAIKTRFLLQRGTRGPLSAFAVPPPLLIGTGN